MGPTCRLPTYSFIFYPRSFLPKAPGSSILAGAAPKRVESSLAERRKICRSAHLRHIVLIRKKQISLWHKFLIFIYAHGVLMVWVTKKRNPSRSSNRALPSHLVRNLTDPPVDPTESTSLSFYKGISHLSHVAMETASGPTAWTWESVMLAMLCTMFFACCLCERCAQFMRLALSELNIELILGETSSDSEGHGLLKDSDLASSETCSSPDCSLISLGFGQQSVAAEMDWDQIGRQVRMEARLMLLVALLPLVSAPWTTCISGPPTWLYILYLPFLLRSKIVEYQIIRKFGIDWGPALLFEYGMGVFEHLDWFTDGAFPAQAYMCEPDITAAWAAAFDHSWGWVWAPIIRMLHFCGVVVLVLILSMAAQQSALVPFCYSNNDLPDFTLWDQQNIDRQKEFPVASRWPPELILERNQASRTALSADTACFGAVAMLSDKISDAAISKCRGMSEPSFRVEDTFSIFLLRLRDRQYSMVLFKVVFENLAQLYLQVSLYSILFDDLSPSARFKLLVSISAALLSAFRRLCDVALRLKQSGWHVCCGLTTYVFPGMMVLLWVGLKLYFAHTCPHHQWNFSTGCVGWKKELMKLHLEPQHLSVLDQYHHWATIQWPCQRCRRSPKLCGIPPGFFSGIQWFLELW